MFDFGASVGTDYLQSTLTAHSTTRSWAFWCRWDGTAHTGFPRFFDKGGNEAFFYSDLSFELRFLRSWTSGDEQWGWDRFAIGTLTHVVLTYDSSSTANDPVCYYNGVLQTLTANAAPTGSLTDNANSYYFANRAAQDRGLDGAMAEIAIWDVILTADEAAALGAGHYSPMMIRPHALVEYIPCVRQAVSLKRGAPTLNGGSVVAHPRVFYPHRRLILPKAAAGGGGTTYNDSLTETASLAESLASAHTMVDAFTESAAVAEALATAMTMGNALGESVTLAEALAHVMTMPNAFTETVTLADQYSDGNIFNDTLTETVTLGDGHTAVMVFANTVADAVTLAEAFATVGTFVDSMADAIVLADSYAATGGESAIWTVVSPAGGTWTAVTPAGGTWTPQ